MTTATIGDGAVTYDKLNYTAKISPIKLITASVSLSADDLGKTLVTNDASTKFVFTVPDSTSLVVGYEVAILNYLSASTTIEFASGVKTLTENKGILTASSFEVRPNEKIILKKITSDSWLWTEAGSHVKVYNNAGAHNSVYRGLYLGASVSDAQWNAIAAGTFDDMYIGDHWYINGFLWRIAAFDYYYQTGDEGGICTTHHVTIVPDVCLDSQQMNTKNIVTNGYVGSAMYTANLENSKTIIANAFGSSHILSHRNILNNLVSSGRQTGAVWRDSTVELMTEQNVFGTSYFSIPSTTSTASFLLRADKSQFPLFTFQPWRIGGRQWYWLRDVASTTQFSLVDGQGICSYYIASGTAGVRPSFSICKENA